MLQNQIDQDIKSAILSQDKDRLNTLRSLKTELSNVALQGGSINKPLEDMEVLSAIRKQIKSRECSASMFADAGRNELAKKEKTEIQILENYLPQPLSEEEIEAIISDAIASVQATSKREMGKVISLALKSSAGRIDNKTLSSKIAAKLQ